jgi:hypothetical protein
LGSVQDPHSTGRNFGKGNMKKKENLNCKDKITANRRNIHKNYTGT